jgi:hypothetical protein
VAENIRSLGLINWIDAKLEVVGENIKSLGLPKLD